MLYINKFALPPHTRGMNRNAINHSCSPGSDLPPHTRGMNRNRKEMFRAQEDRAASPSYEGDE